MQKQPTRNTAPENENISLQFEVRPAALLRLAEYWSKMRLKHATYIKENPGATRLLKIFPIFPDLS